MRPGSHAHLFCSGVQFGLWYKIPSRAIEGENSDSDSDNGNGISTQEAEGREQIVFDVQGVPLHCTRDMGNMMTSKCSHKTHHVRVYE